MSLKRVPLHQKTHANLNVKIDRSYAHVRGQHLIPVVIHEFAQVCIEYPIVFVKNEQNGRFRAVAMTGVVPGENLYVGEEWRAPYIPASVTHFPLSLIPDAQNKDQVLVAIIEGSDLLSRELGEALFDERGNNTPYLEQRKKKMIQYLESEQVTFSFLQMLADLNVLAHRSLTLNIEGNPLKLEGVYMVDESKLNELDDSKFIDLRKRGLLTPIYSHLCSLAQVNRLTLMKAKR
ncbi:SapC family protein [Echinimonas agarilytica]|uniref:SapC family protein n=1 Tax=Echinimonas agarilytica TaxID=1215918 RepID=A0AA41W4X4_9GAMM|nr:SapC family protein [Echinimonas agarilytica]MCM2679039.1 SapC family protein [Echinimonas agarilytica]